MSLRDSGTKNGKFLRVLTVFVLVAALLVVTGVVALADTAEGVETSVEQVDDTKYSSGYPKLPEDADLSERLMYGLQITGIGMVVVFLVLIIIMAILYVFKLFANVGNKKPEQVPAAPAPAAPVASVSDDEETVVAIATAAIAASRGASDCAFKVISVTKIQ